MGFKELQQAKQAADAAKALVSDPVTAHNLKVLIHEADKALRSAQQNPELKSGSLREAFNTAAGLVPIGYEFVDKKKIPVVQLLKKKGELERMAARFERAVNENDPVVLGLLDSLQNNTTAQEATVKLAARHPDKFHLQEDGKGGGSLKLDLFPGQSFTVPIDAEYFPQAQDIVAKAKAKNQPKPGA